MIISSRDRESTSFFPFLFPSSSIRGSSLVTFGRLRDISRSQSNQGIAGGNLRLRQLFFFFNFFFSFTCRSNQTVIVARFCVASSREKLPQYFKSRWNTRSLITGDPRDLFAEYFRPTSRSVTFNFLDHSLSSLPHAPRRLADATTTREWSVRFNELPDEKGSQPQPFVRSTDFLYVRTKLGVIKPGSDLWLNLLM